MAIQPDLVPKEQFPQAVALGRHDLQRRTRDRTRARRLRRRRRRPRMGVRAQRPVLPRHPARACSAGGRRAPATAMPAESFSGATRAGLRYAAHSPLLRAVLVRVGLLVLPGAALQALLPDRRPRSARPRLRRLRPAARLLRRRRRPRRRAPSRASLGCSPSDADDRRVVVGGRRRRCWSRATSTQPVVAGRRALPRRSGVEHRRHRADGGRPGVAAGMGPGTGHGPLHAGAHRQPGLRQRPRRGARRRGPPLAHLVAAVAVALGALARCRWPITTTREIDLTMIPGDEPDVVLTPSPARRPRARHRHLLRAPTTRWRTSSSGCATSSGTAAAPAPTGGGCSATSPLPDRFLETFVVSSWAEHLRQHHRRTAVADELLQSVRPYMVAENAVAHSSRRTAKAGRPPERPSTRNWV